ncbi:MAG: hypothetical protein ACK41C_10490 [Phenylobacterium sp.]|uniref:hypothetical protein n=1 Tax=Phenylobacterium sp. TaxID=1871053 RepID=UPI00391AF3CA
MAAVGRFSDINLTRTAIFREEGDWAPELPLDNLKTDDRYVAAPARCLAVDDPDASRLALDLPTARVTSLIAVLFHTLSIDARYRLTIAGIERDLDDPVFQTDWTPVYGRMNPSRMLPWETTNWWSGQISLEEIDLLPRHLWIPYPAQLTGAMRLEFNDEFNEHGFFDLGGLWIASGFSPAINFDRGHSLGLQARDLVDEAPSGRIIGERRRARRSLTVPYSSLTTDEAHRFFDAGVRVGVTRPVIFVPNLDHQPSLIRQAFPATFERLPDARFTYERAHQVVAVLKETLA